MFGGRVFLKLNEQGELTYILSKRGYKSLFKVNSDGVIRKQLSMVNFQKNYRKKERLILNLFGELMLFSVFLFLICSFITKEN